MQDSVIKVSIIEDSLIHAEWINERLTDSPMFEVVSNDTMGYQGIASVRSMLPDIAIVDFQLSDITGLECAKRIKSHCPAVKIFILTAHNVSIIVERIITDKNIDGVAIKGSYYFDNNFLNAVSFVANNGSFVDPSLLEILRGSGKYQGLRQLTKREFEVFIQVNMGKEDQEISDDLYVDVMSIKNIKSKIAKKIKGDEISDLLKNLYHNVSQVERL